MARRGEPFDASARRIERARSPGIVSEPEGNAPGTPLAAAFATPVARLLR